VIDDPTPAGLTNRQVSGDCAALPCNIASLAAGGTVALTVSFSVPPDYAGAQFSNIASVGSDTSDPDLNNNVSSFSTTVGTGADVRATMTASSSTSLGGRLIYTTTVTNVGPSVASNVELDSTVPAGLVFVSNSGDCSGAFPCTFGTLQPGDVKSVTTTACVPPNYSGSVLISSSANATSSTSDPNAGNNAAAAFTALMYDVLFADGFESCQ
jgi:uncharacterized repeat protein (TIGR01451 family)